MNRKDLWTVVTVAAGTAALTVTAFWPDSLDAGDGPQALAPKNSRPKLTAGGIEFSLTSEAGRNYSAGDEPAFELLALNTNSSAAQATIHLAMSTTSPADAMSRVVRTPSLLWQADQSVALAPGESKTVVVHTGTKLPPNNLISVLLGETTSGAQVPAPAIKPTGSLKEKLPLATGGIAALSFSTAVPRGEPALVISTASVQQQVLR